MVGGWPGEARTLLEHALAVVNTMHPSIHDDFVRLWLNITLHKPKEGAILAKCAAIFGHLLSDFGARCKGSFYPIVLMNDVLNMECLPPSAVGRSGLVRMWPGATVHLCWTVFDRP